MAKQRKQPEKVPLVFVCYSRKDAATLEELRMHLRPFEQRGELMIWYDLKIAPGDTPDERIQAVIADADIVLMLVSPEFLASTYIEQNELPPIVKAGAKRTTRVVPFFIRATMVRDKRLSFVIGEGEKVPLTYWQGLNQPTESLPEPGQARDHSFVAACTKLLDLATEVKAESRRAAAARTQAGRRTSRTDDFPEVSLRLTVEGTTLQREFLGPHNWRWTARTEQFAGLNTPTTRVWEPDQMFAALFGTEAECTFLLRETRGVTNRTSPVSSGGVRLRLSCDDARLLAQPWLRTAWQQNNLVEAGWSIELSATPLGTARGPLSHLRLELPCTLVAVGLDPDRRLNCDEHLDAACTIGSRAGLTQAPIARSARELEALAHHQPDILYVCGVATVDSEDAWLRADTTSGRLRIADVIANWDHHPPKILFLNLVDAPLGLTQAAIARLAERIPLVVLQCARGAQVGAAYGPFQAAERVLEGLLNGDDPDPVRLLVTHGLPSVHVWTHFGKLVRTASQQTPRLSPRRDLDREDQRAQALLQCKTLSETTDHRTALLLAHGEAGNHLELLGQQLELTLRSTQALRRLTWHLPRSGNGRVAAQELAEQFDAEFRVMPGLTRRQTFANRHKEWFKSKTIGLFVFDTGVFGGRHAAPLRPTDIEALASFCREDLAPSCPDSCRIVILTGLEVERPKFAAIAAMADRLRDHGQTHQFRFRSLKPLEAVTRHDLKSYLDKPGSGCPPAMADSFAGSVHQASRGRFEHAVKLLEQAAIDGWSPTALSRIQGEQNGPPTLDTPSADDPL